MSGGVPWSTDAGDLVGDLERARDMLAESPAYELDPRWEWVEARQLCHAEPIMLRGACRHLEVVDVESVVTGDLVARLCVTCDQQFEVDP